jgi:hypothetical protein
MFPNINTLSSEKPRIDGPNSRAQHCQGCAKGCQHKATSQTGSSRKGRRQLNHYDQHSGHGCTKADEKKDSGAGRERLPYDSIPLRRSQQFGESVMDQENSDD